MYLRYLAILAIAIAGFIRSPYSPFEITNVPAYELFYSAWGAIQIMWAIYYLWKPSNPVTKIGILLSGSSIMLVTVSRLIDIPFTNSIIIEYPAHTFTMLTDGIAFVSLILYLTKSSKTRQQANVTIGSLFAMSAMGGFIIWGIALLIEPALPDLAHQTVDQFEVYDQIAMLSNTDYEWDLPKGFPVPYVPDDNPMTEAKVELGRYLFYDTKLSGNNTMSCASCHHQGKAFTDGVAVPIGSTGESHIRNSQTLTNTAYNSTYTWANPVLTEVEQQIVIPMFGEFPVEMGITGKEDIVLARFRDDALYQVLFTSAFPDVEDPISFHHVVQSLSSFIRTMISGNSPYDQFVYQKDYEALSKSALRGMDLFLSERFECHHCHGGFNFTLSTRHANTTFLEQPFFNTGLYNIDGNGTFPRGNRGVFEITGNDEDMGRFRPPTLRNIELTAPYMHDGSIATLEEVIDFYSDGGRMIETGEYAGDGRDNPFKSGLVPGFEITDQEKEDLLNFLRSLTDETFITDPHFSDPFGDANQ